MTWTRILALSGLMLALALGIWLFSRSAPLPGPAVTQYPRELRLPRVWLGPLWRQMLPTVSLAVEHAGQAHPIVYWDAARNRRAAEVRPLARASRPSGWSRVSTRYGKAWLQPQRRVLILPDLQGGAVELTTEAGDVRGLLPDLQALPAR